MKIIIVEDELHSSRMLNGMVKELRPDWEIQGSFESIKTTVEWLKNSPAPDLIFLDIQLTDGESFAIFDQVDVKSMVIFTTAYDEYAIQAFDVNSVDYLLKPIKKEKLEKAIEKFENYFQYADTGDVGQDYKQLIDAIRNSDKKYKQRFLISGATAFFKINTSDIAYFYVGDRITFAVTFDKKEHVINSTLDKIEEELDPRKFFRVNRSFLINSESVQKFESFFGGKLAVFLTPPPSETVTISRLKATAFKKWMDY